ncbi:RidA family protein [Ramlibacter pallidus]|uniref:RidA family protein n=1 Tax=Ramlibacter pallidus TaxID=2780087 RepID=A0ABR9S654_9BURK|nr:RidA family protein [Ramlibacter pallidus]MBE7368996.1 RidA family protein [Ramlibacter pallidus]
MNAIQLFNPAGLYDPVPNGYSHGATVEAGVRLVLLSGQGGEDQAGALRAGYAAQLRQALDNMLLALAAAGAGPEHVARLLVLVVDHDEPKLHQLGAEFDRIWGDRLKPACTLIPVPRLALDGMLVEIEATAAVPV